MKLDLTAADKKLSRAAVHLDAIKAEMQRIVDDPNSKLFSAHLEVDEQSSWIALFMRLSELPKNDFDVLFGDFIHNLRATLDYIVAALVQYCGVKMTRHEFPIFTNGAEYHRVIGDPKGGVGKNRLSGITYGLDLIDGAQPYHKQPEPKAHPLWLLHRFSNADKHRELTVLLNRPTSVEMDVEGRPFDPIVLERQGSLDWTGGMILLPHVDIHVGSVRIAKPYPQQIRVGPATMHFDPVFISEAFGDEPNPVGCPMPNLKLMYEYIAELIESFKALSKPKPTPRKARGKRRR